MATIKSFTDILQSKKLAEILPLEGADYCWGIDEKTLCYNNSPYPCPWKDYTAKQYYVPCWSLAALLSALPRGEHKDIDLCCGGYKGDKYIPEWFCSYEQQEPTIIEICHTDNPVDACVAMIERLHELKIL